MMRGGPAVRLRSASRAGLTTRAAPRAGLVIRMPPALSLDLLAAVLTSGAAPQFAVLALAHALEEAGEPGDEVIRSAQRLLDGSALDGVARSGPGPGAPGENRSPSCDLEPERAGGPDRGDTLSRAIASALSLSRRSGLPPAELMKAAAVRERSRRSVQARAAIRRLEVLLLIPAGICLLPAFIVLGIVPVVIALLGH